MTNTPDKSEIAQPIMEAVGSEMRRIKALFEPHTGDAEDLITYARDVAALREAARAPSRPADQVPDMVERLGETLHDLSDSLRQIGFFSGERKHIARYEAVVSAFENLAALQAVPAASGLTKREEHLARLEIRNALGPSSGSIFPEPPALKASGEE